jgi:hypothetical protein
MQASVLRGSARRLAERESVIMLGMAPSGQLMTPLGHNVLDVNDQRVLSGLVTTADPSTAGCYGLGRVESIWWHWNWTKIYGGPSQAWCEDMKAAKEFSYNHAFHLKIRDLSISITFQPFHWNMCFQIKIIYGLSTVLAYFNITYDMHKMDIQFTWVKRYLVFLWESASIKTSNSPLKVKLELEIFIILFQLEVAE